MPEIRLANDLDLARAREAAKVARRVSAEDVAKTTGAWCMVLLLAEAVVLQALGIDAMIRRRKAGR